jgi:hypothetical protein
MISQRDFPTRRTLSDQLRSLPQFGQEGGKGLRQEESFCNPFTTKTNLQFPDIRPRDCALEM